MRKLVFDQISKCDVADTSNILETETGYLIRIKKYSKPKFDIDKSYIITLSGDDYVEKIKQQNNGTFPANSCLKIYVSRQLGKLIFVDSIGYDLIQYKDILTMWSGWLHIDNITLVATL